MSNEHELDAVRDDAGHVLEGPYKHLRVLERRKAYLNRRIEEAEKQGKNLTHDRHEAEALDWAIGTIYDWVSLPEKE